MKNIALHRADIEDIAAWIQKYPGSDYITITVDSSSGIGSVVSASLNAVINGDMVTISKTFVDESAF